MSRRRIAMVAGSVMLLPIVVAVQQQASAAPSSPSVTLTVDPLLAPPESVCGETLPGAVRLTWNAPADPSIASFHVEYRAVGTTTWTEGPAVDNPPVSTTSSTSSTSSSIVTTTSLGTTTTLQPDPNPRSIDLPGTDDTRYEYRVASLSAAGERSNWGGYCTVGWGSGMSVPQRVATPPQPATPFDGTGDLTGMKVLQVVHGSSHSCALADTGVVACWGNNGWLQTGRITNVADVAAPTAIEPGPLAGETVVALAAGGDSTCALTAAGQVACWGYNYQTELGVADSTTSSSTLPAFVTTGALTGRKVVGITKGANFACALTDSGMVACWGQGSVGQLGNGQFAGIATSPIPISPGDLAGQTVVGLGSGASHTCARAADSLVACWGQNYLGLLGVGSDVNVATPTAITGSMLAVGGLSTLAVSVPPDTSQTYGLWSGIGVPGMPPSQPLAVTTFNSGRNVTLNWQAPVSTGASPVTSYVVESSRDAGRTWSTTPTTPATPTTPTAAVLVGADDYWRFRVRALSASGISAPSEPSREILVKTLTRTSRASVPIVFRTPDGQPIVGSSVSWATTDGLNHSAGSVALDASGTATFPLIYTGPVTFTVTGGHPATANVALSSATLTTYVQQSGSTIIQVVPPVPAIVTRSLSVVMPDDTPVPDTQIVIGGGVSTAATAGYVTNLRHLEANWVHGISLPTSSGSTGTVAVTGFAVPSRGADVSATFSDGFVVQTAYAPLTQPTNTVRFEQLPAVRMISTPPAPLDPGAGATVTVLAVDGAGNPIPNQSLTISAPTVKGVAMLPLTTTRGLPACTPVLSGKTAANGRLTFRVCPSSTKSWRADGASIVASKPLKIPVKPAPKAIAAGDTHTCALLADATARCWGNNSNGQLGNGTLATSTTPVAVTGLNAASLIAVGNGFSCATVTTAGKVECWGANTSGQLGDGTTTRRTTPVFVTTAGTTALTGATRLAAGADFACVVRSPGAAGVALCWGGNAYGQLGDGSITRRSRPVVVKANTTMSLKGVNRIAGGVGHTCALMNSGAVKCWGLNNYGQLGNGITRSSRYPVSVAGIDGVATKATAIVTGNGYSCARISNGTVRCWGRDNVGQLGDGGSATRTRPAEAKVSALAQLVGVTTITAGASHACAVVGTGSGARLRCWGSNASGQLGNGGTTNSRYAVFTTTVGAITSVSAGTQHTVALVSSTSRPPSVATTWGRNANGQLGNGTTTNRSTPGILTRL